MWPDNEAALSIFQRVGTRWRLIQGCPIPIGLQWEAIYPLMDRLGLDNDAWNDLHEALMVMEDEALATRVEFAKRE